MCEIHFDTVTVTFTYCTETFYLHLTDYFHYSNSLYQSHIHMSNMIGIICKLHLYSAFSIGVSHQLFVTPMRFSYD